MQITSAPPLRTSLNLCGKKDGETKQELDVMVVSITSYSTTIFFAISAVLAVLAVLAMYSRFFRRFLFIWTRFSDLRDTHEEFKRFTEYSLLQFAEGRHPFWPEYQVLVSENWSLVSSEALAKDDGL